MGDLKKKLMIDIEKLVDKYIYESKIKELEEKIAEIEKSPESQRLRKMQKLLSDYKKIKR